MKTKSLFILFSLCFFIWGCTKKSDVLEFETTDPKALQPGVEWLLVESPYASCHENAGYDEDVTNHLRRGEIRMVKGNQTVKTDGIIEKWYLIDEGWMPDSSVHIYSNRLKAENAKKSLNM